MKLLLAEDDRIVRITVRDALTKAGYRVTQCADGISALQAAQNEAFDVVVSDVRMPGLDGIALFRRLRQVQPDVAVLLMTAYADTREAVDVMRAGASDYLVKPFRNDELLLRLQRLREEFEFRRNMASASAASACAGRIRIASAAGRWLVERVEAAALCDLAVLLSGETGSGKDLCARVIHERGRRASKPFVALNCAAIPDNLLESELFGHEKGAFPGADRRRAGRFEAAAGGTLFLDEVGELTPAGQAKLLRVLDSFTFEPLGSSRSISVDVRVISATSRDLAAEVERGAFRGDLFYRLSVVDIHVPPLRERRADIPLLVRDILAGVAKRQGRPLPALDPDAVAALAAHEFPGNVRELIHALERAVALSPDSIIRVAHLPQSFEAPATAERETYPLAVHPSSGEVEPLAQATRRFEQEYVRRVLAKADGHRARAAALLGISRKSLWERLRGTPGEPQEPEE